MGPERRSGASSMGGPGCAALSRTGLARGFWAARLLGRRDAPDRRGEGCRPVKARPTAPRTLVASRGVGATKSRVSLSQRFTALDVSTHGDPRPDDFAQEDRGRIFHAGVHALHALRPACWSAFRNRRRNRPAGLSSAPARRRTGSAFVTILSRRLLGSTTGTDEMPRSLGSLANDATGMSGGTVATSLVIRSHARSGPGSMAASVRLSGPRRQSDGLELQLNRGMAAAVGRCAAFDPDQCARSTAA